MLRVEGLELVEKADFNPDRVKHPRFIGLTNEEKNRRISENPRYGNVICRCERVTEGEIVEAIKKGAITLDGVKFRTRAGMGRCQGNFCGTKTVDILAKELNCSFENITKKGPGSNFIAQSDKPWKRNSQIT
jgi:glycerol-3-phosphate dehydrogenase